jgi:hypothetical protein
MGLFSYWQQFCPIIFHLLQLNLTIAICKHKKMTLWPPADANYSKLLKSQVI